MKADILQDATRAVVRPGEEVETAVVKLLDARGTLLELRVHSLGTSQIHLLSPFV